MIYAYQFIARDRSGLHLTVDDDGMSGWVGTADQWREAERLEANFTRI